MANDIKISGLIDRNITPSIIHLVRESPSRDHIGTLVDRIFEIIKDFVCWTNMTEAKKCLFDLYAYRDAPENEEAKDKLARLSTIKKSYERLKELVGENYKDRFFEVEEKSGYSINIDFGGAVNNYKFKFDICNAHYIAKEIKREFTVPLEVRHNNFYKDLSRSTYIVDKQDIGNIACMEAPTSVAIRRSMNRFDAVLKNKLKSTAKQLRAVKALSFQNIFGIILSSSLHQNGGVFQSAPFAFLTKQEKVIYSYKNNQRIIEVHCAAQFSWSDRQHMEDFGEEERPEFMNKAWVTGDFAIAPNGKVTVMRASVGTI